MSNIIINLSGYKFVKLNDLPALQQRMLDALTHAQVLGTILLAEEGINVALAGQSDNIKRATDWFAEQADFKDIWFKKSNSSFTPFAKLKVRIRPEIIAFDGGQTRPENQPAPAISPIELKKWLDEGRDFVLLDTRNNYETASGSFTQAQLLDLENFRDFPSAMAQLGAADRGKPIVTFCTGGIRCEKAAPWMLQNGFQEVYQVKGGILNYLQQCGGEHWQGECFVFDDRVEVDTNLAEVAKQQCSRCHRAASAAAKRNELYTPNKDCEDCLLMQQRVIN